MRKLCFEKNKNNCCFVDMVGDRVVVVSKGASNPFDYLDQLTNSVRTLTSKTGLYNVEVYVDFLSCVGDRVNRFGKALFNHDTKSIDIFSFVNVTNDAIPENIKQHLALFYKKHTNSLIKNSVLTEQEILKIRKAAI